MENKPAYLGGYELGNYGRYVREQDLGISRIW